MARIQNYLERKIEATPQQRIGIAGFTAYVTIEETTSKSATVPMSYVEDGSFVNDHQILNPVKVSIQGNVSNVYLESSPIIEELTRTQATVGLVTQYVPDRTEAQVQQVNALINDITDAVRAVDNILDGGEQVLKFFGNQDSSSKSNQELFLDAMDSLYYGKQLFTVNTKYRSYENMTMTLFETRRNNETNATDFSIEATEFRLAETQFVELEAAPNPSAGVNGQLDPENSKGLQDGVEANKSALFTLIGKD